MYKVTVYLTGTDNVVREKIFDTELKAETFAMICEFKKELTTKVEKILKQGLTNFNSYDIISTELRKGNREERNSQVEDVRPDRQRQLSRMAVIICAL